MDNQKSKICQDQFVEAPPARDCRYEKCLDKKPLAMAYVPWQAWGNTFRAEAALEKGTIFADLDLPWVGNPAERRRR